MKAFFYILLLLLLTVMVGSYLYLQKSNSSQNASILADCAAVHVKGNIHYHVTLKIMQDGKNILVPANIGIVGECIHPIHTHDSTGLIHVDYPKVVPFSLGDVFDMQGISFNDNQIGSIKTSDQYKIIVKVNGTIIKNGYRNIPLRDRDVIDIEIVRDK